MRFFAIILAVALSLPASPLVVTGLAQTTAAGSISGTATSSTGEALVNVTVQLRDLSSGAVVATTTSSSTGGFRFDAVGPGSYVVEVLNASGQVVSTSASISVTAGAAITGVIVGATAETITASAASMAGVSTIVAVSAAAAAAGVIGVVRTRPGDFSPSR